MAQVLCSIPVGRDDELRMMAERGGTVAEQMPVYLRRFRKKVKPRAVVYEFVSFDTPRINPG